MFWSLPEKLEQFRAGGNFGDEYVRKSTGVAWTPSTPIPIVVGHEELVAHDNLIVLSLKKSSACETVKFDTAGGAALTRPTHP